MASQATTVWQRTGPPLTEADARKLLADFLPRAFRRPVTADEVQRYVALCNARLADGDLFEVAMRMAYQRA